jgi:hypothetical protein
MTDYSKLSLEAVQQLTKQLLRKRPATEEDRKDHTATLRALAAEIRARMEK